MKLTLANLVAGFISAWLLGYATGSLYAYLGVIYQALTSSEKE